MGLFDLIEARFYNPSVTAHMISENNRNAKIIEEFFKDTEDRLSETLKTDAVRSSLMSERNQDDYSTLSEIFGPAKEDSPIKMQSKTQFEMQWVRFIEYDGTSLYFSTYGPDIIDYTYQIPFYGNYNDPDLPYELIAVQNGGAPKYTLDNKSGRILFSFPLYDSFDIYCGTALFSFSMDSVLDRLFNEGMMIPGKVIMLIPNPPGMVFGNLSADEKLMPNQISSVWEAGGSRTARLPSSDSGIPYILVSTKTSQGLFIGSVINEELYLFPWDMKLILLLSFFLTIYLTIFLLFSLKQEPVTIIQNRLKHLQVSLLEQFYELKGEEDWGRWIREMDYRRDEISALLKKGIRPASDNLNEDINILINKSWDEFLSMLGSRREPGFDEEKLRSAINGMLAALPKTGKDLLSGGEGSSKKEKTGLLGRASAIVKELEETDLVEELEDLEDLNGPEDLQKPGISENKKTAARGPASKPPDVDLAAVASQIEFSPDPEPESAGDDSIEPDLEIVSPFSAMLDDFTDTIDYDDPGQEIETIPKQGNVIKEKEGLPFVSADALNPDEKEEEFINRDFKNLVDSVIKD